MSPIEEVHVPPKVTSIDPAKSQDKRDEYWERKAREARLQNEYLEQKRIQEQLAFPPAPQEPPVKISGAVNLGTFDMQQMQKEAQERMERMMSEKEKEVKESRDRAERLAEEKKQLEIETLRRSVDEKITELQRMVAQGLKQPKSFMEQYEEAIAVANKLGMAQPQATGEDPRIKIEMLKLQAEMAREERNFKRELRNDEKKWSMELEKLQQERQARDDQVRAEKEKMNMFANSFKGLGSAIAAGIMENAGSVTSEPNPVTRPAPVPQRAQSKSGKQKIQAAVGEVGEVQCPECDTPIGIGPDTELAECTNCGKAIPVVRR